MLDPRMDNYCQEVKRTDSAIMVDIDSNYTGDPKGWRQGLIVTVDEGGYTSSSVWLTPEEAQYLGLALIQLAYLARTREGASG